MKWLKIKMFKPNVFGCLPSSGLKKMMTDIDYYYYYYYYYYFLIFIYVGLRRKTFTLTEVYNRIQRFHGLHYTTLLQSCDEENVPENTSVTVVIELVCRK